jgi:Ala-tRNA(Pro) deacylase
MKLVEPLSVETYLERRNVRFEVTPHAGVFTARSQARALGLPSADVLKAVLLRMDSDYAMCVIPASRRLDLNLVRRLTPDHLVRLATEDEIIARFPESELGALPPLPGFLGIRAFVDPLVFDHATVAFADGRQTESMIADPKGLFWGEDVTIGPISQDPELAGPWGPVPDTMGFG